MKAFDPEPMESKEAAADWVFTRSLVISVFTFLGAVLARDLFAPLGTVVAGIVLIVGSMYWYQVLFRGIDAYLDGRAGDGR